MHSISHNRIYVGMTNNVKQRLKDHNRGHVFSTKGYRPWFVFFEETVETRELARTREKYWKSGCGKEQLKIIFRGSSVG